MIDSKAWDIPDIQPVYIQLKPSPEIVRRWVDGAEACNQCRAAAKQATAESDRLREGLLLIHACADTLTPGELRRYCEELLSATSVS